MIDIKHMVTISLIQWLLQPETIMFILGFLVSVPALIKKLQQAKKEQYRSIAMTFAWDIVKKLSQRFDIKNDEKLRVAVSLLYEQLPDKAKKYLSENDLIEIINSIYHTYIKPDKDPN